MSYSFFQFFNIPENVDSRHLTPREFISNYGGRAFGNGLFNTFSQENLALWTDIVNRAYPMLKGKFELFGYDWLGRCFAVDKRSSFRKNIFLFEIGTDDVLMIPGSFTEFINNTMISDADACLAKGLFDEWTAAHNHALSYGNCVSYKIPLFLGGEDDFSNMEESDMEVYWEILIQVKNKLG